MKREVKHIVLYIALVMLSGACAPTLPKESLQPPTQWIHERGDVSDSVKFTRSWWLIFQDTTLTYLIECALESNRDIASAAALVESSRAELRVDRAAYLPELSVDISGERYRTQSEGKVSEYYIEPTISWEVSLFGALRNTKKAARAAILASEWALLGVELSVASEVASEYFQWREALRSLEIAQLSYQVRQEKSMLIDSMVRYGMATCVTQEQARSLVYTAMIDIAQYRRNAENIRMNLATLIGVTPLQMIDNSSLRSEIDFSNLALPSYLPSDVLARRWDVQQSYAQMSEAAAKVGIAHAARYPTITLTGSTGLLSATLRGLSQNNPWAWSLAGELVAPVVGWGKLKGAESAARASYLSSLMQYENSMLTCFAEVEQALVAIDGFEREFSSTARLVEANMLIANSVGALYDSGMEDYLNVLDAERELYSSQLSLESVATSCRLSYIALYKALGGGVL